MPLITNGRPLSCRMYADALTLVPSSRAECAVVAATARTNVAVIAQKNGKNNFREVFNIGREAGGALLPFQRETGMETKSSRDIPFRPAGQPCTSTTKSVAA